MKKNSLFLILILLIFSCSKKENFVENTEYVVTKYDTTAIDSFANGAISVDVAEQIRKSSIAYQDSLKAKSAEEAAAKLEAETKAKEEEKAKAEAKKESDKQNSEKSKNSG